ncbi:MAG: hypothetical protein PHP64_08870 [Actinomycetota bacterium]|nr:hypothetical protein [Actinomycetota bacterium]
MRPRKTPKSLSLLVAMFLFAFPQSLITQTNDTPYQKPLPKGFESMDDASWDPPWIFKKSQHGWKPLTELDNSHGDLRNNPIKIRLDNGTRGSLKVEQRDCRKGEDCSPYDCGCFDYDSYWIHIKNAAGQEVGKYHLWAAYGGFEIIPVDLVDGPGDELIIIRIPNRGSPSVGRQLLIWKLGGKKPADLTPEKDFFAASWFNGCCCAIW